MDMLAATLYSTNRDMVPATGMPAMTKTLDATPYNTYYIASRHQVHAYNFFLETLQVRKEKNKERRRR